MKKIDEKAFKLLKVLVVFVVVIVSGLYYILFVEKDIEKPMETVSYTATKKIDIVIPTISIISTESDVDNTSYDNYIVEVEPINSKSSSSIAEKSIDFDLIIDGKININVASSEELQTLKNIGPVVASNIIAYREENGNFINIEDIKNVKGIGDAKFNTIKDFIYAR